MLKKLLLAALACFGGYFAYKKSQQAKAEQDLWAEAVDSVERSTRWHPATEPHLGGVAQLVEHCLCKAGVRGSSPLVSTTP